MYSAPVVVVAGRHRPHELMLLAVSVILGVAYILGAPQPGSLAESLPGWMFTGWALVMLASGTLGLIGCFWRDADLGMEIERGAMVMQAGAIVLYTSGLFAYAGTRALASGGIAAVWAGANAWRAVQITRDLRAIDRASP